MTIAELFVNIGIKGDGEAQKALKNVKGGLGEISSTGLAAKAALVGVVYGLERLTGVVSQRGLELQQFSNLTGLSTDMLQRWQYAARQSGVSAEEMAGSLKGVQSVMVDMLMGKGAPAGMGILARAVGFDMSKARDTFYVMGKLKEFAKSAPADVGNSVLKTFGLSESTIQFLRSTKVELDKIKPSNIFSPGEIATLARVNIAWSNFWNSIQMFTGHMAGAFGLNVISSLQRALTLTQHLVSEFTKLIKKFPVLGTVAKAALAVIGAELLILGGPLTAIATAITGIIYLFSEWQKHREGKKSLFGDKNFKGNVIEEFMNSDLGKLLKKPMADQIPYKKQPQDQGKTIQQQNTFNINEANDPHGTPSSMQKYLNDALRQMSAQGQGS